MSIFDRIERQDIEPASQLIGQFDYLNASARAEAGRVRDVVDSMVERYPAPHSADLTLRIRWRDNTLHSGAMLELITHDTLLSQNSQIVEIEPRVANGRASDFLVEGPDVQRFYVECTVAHGPAGTDPGADSPLREALQAIILEIN